MFTLSSKDPASNHNDTHVPTPAQTPPNRFRLICKSLFRRLLLIGLLVLTIGAPIVYLALRNPSEAEAAWFDDSWAYRKSIAVTNNTTDQTNVYIALTIDTSATTKFQPNCVDLRFTKQGGELLPYNIVSGCTTASTVIHVLLDSFPAGAQTIYYYYGNLTASNGASPTDFSTQASDYTIGSLGSEEKSQGPVAYWKFDDGQGLTAQDSSSSNNDGTLSGTTKPTWTTEDQCVSGKCLQFDGSANYVNAGNNSSLNATSGISVSAWVNPLAASEDNKWIIAKGLWGGDTDGDYWLATTPGSNTFRFAVRIGSTNYRADAFIYSANNWYYLTGTFDGGSVKLYVNGVLQQTTAASGTIGTNTHSLVIGGNSGANANFKGFIDEPKIYPYARTAAQVKADYAAGLAHAGSLKGISASLGSNPENNPALSQGLVGYWKMDETSWSGTSADILDASGNSNNGTAACYDTGCTKPTGGAAGEFGNGGSFDGSTQYVDVGDPSSGVLDFSLTNSFTTSAWIKTSGTSETILAKYSGNALWEFTVNSTGKVGYQLRGSDGAGLVNVRTNTAANDDNWHHIVAVRDYNSRTIYVYLDGSLSNSATESLTAGMEGTGHASIGARWQNAGSVVALFNGTIDELRVYNRALSSKEVSDLYTWAPGSVGYWKMDDKVSGNTKTIVDSSGYGNNGTTYYGANATGMDCTKPGKYGGACSFDGTDDYVDVGNVSAVDMGTNSFTAELWMKTSVGGSLRRLLVKRASDNSKWYDIQLRATNVIYASMADNNPTNGLATALGSKNVVDGQWHHITAVYNRSGNIQIYIDGVPDGTPADISGETGNLGNDGHLFIGAYGTGNGPPYLHFYNGSLDDVKIYNYARTQKQIISDMNAGHPNVGSPIGSPVGYWKFDEGYGTTANNSGNGGSALNGTLTCSGTGCTNPNWTNNGKFGKALNFNGGSSYINLGNNSALDFSSSSSWTDSFWFSPSSVQNSSDAFPRLLSYGTPGVVDGFEIAYRKSISTLSYDSGGWVDTGVPIPKNSWTHIAFVANGSTLTIYKNGLSVYSVAFTGAATGTLYVGNRVRDPSIASITGLIDEVKVYNYALTDDEVKAEYNRGSSLQLGALGNNSQSAPNAASQEYCIPGDTAPCAAPVARWMLDDKVTGTSKSIADTSGNGIAGTTGYGANATGMSCTVTGKYGGACSFDGVDDRISIGNPSDLKLTNALTVEAWVNPTSHTPNSWEHIFVKKNQVGAPWILYGLLTGYTGTKYTFYTSKGGSAQPINSDSSFVPNQWTHVAGTYDGSTMRLYVDGVLQSTTRSVTAPLDDNDGGSMIGGWGGSETWHGRIDDVRIFNYARTPAQIAWDYNRGAPVGWWKFDECQGTTAHDSSGNNNHGTITIGATSTQTSAGTCSDGQTTSAWYNGRTGKRNYSLYFDGVDDDIEIPAIDVTGERTLSFWIYPNSISSNGIFQTKLNNGDTDYLEVSLYLNKVLASANGNAASSAYSSTLSIGHWYHVVITKATGDITKIYVNAKDDTQVANTYLGWNSATNTIGRLTNFTTGQWYFKGQIDDFRIYNYALTATQVKDIYNEGSVKFGPSTGSPL